VRTKEPNRWYSGIPEGSERGGLDTSDSKLEDKEAIPSLIPIRSYESGYVGNNLPASSIQEQKDQELIRRSTDQLMRHSFDQHDFEFVEQVASVAFQDKSVHHQSREYAEKAQPHNRIIAVALALGILLIVYIDRSIR